MSALMPAWDHTTYPQYSVLLKRGEFIDHDRGGRDVPFKIYHPTDHKLKSLPVIIWSHGFGGSRDGAAFLSRYIAAHGYVVVHLTHRGTDSSLWEGKPGHPWDILRSLKIPRTVTLDRFRDVPFALDQLKNWATDNPDPGAFMDFDTMGMSGHSFGAMTTQVMAGQRVPDAAGNLLNFKEDRFKAGIVYSPVPITHMTDKPHDIIYGPIDIPLLHMTGTDDVSPLEGFTYDHRFLVHDHTNHPEKYLLIKNGGDHMVYNGTRGKLKNNDLRERHEEIIKVTSLAFWEAKLKDDQAAHDWLLRQDDHGFLAQDGKLRAQK